MADAGPTLKLTFKDLKQQKFQIEAKPSNTIGEIKEKIAAEKGWEASTQKLIYSGKILQDKNTVESYNIEEKGFVVCMISKPKPTPAASASSSTAAPSTPAKPSTPVQTPAAPTASTSQRSTAVPETPTPAGPPPSTAAPANFNDPSALALGDTRSAAVQQMVDMGFERAQIERAMRAAFNNPDRAVEYLMTGIPADLERDTAPPPRAAAPAAPAGAASTPAPESEAADAGSDAPVNLFEAAANANRAPARGAAAAGAGTGAGVGAGAGLNLDFLRNNPQFQQLRQVVQAQPQMLEPILQQVGAGNPQLAQLISQNPEAFLRLLSEDVEGEDDGMGGVVPPGATQIHVTEEERDAIDRLCGLGFRRELAIQAYFACDKNEELAANFLFEQPPDDDE